MATTRHLPDMWERYYPNVPRVLLETAVETVEAACAAERAGAARLELCADLASGGITPPMQLVALVVAQVRIPVFVMIRPRAGDFVYSTPELTAMHLRMAVAIAAGASGLVFGVLRPDRTVDVPCLRDLVQRAGGLPVTFHRAFDDTPDLDAAMEDVIGEGVTRILTSGGAPAASDGADRLASLVRAAGARATVLAGGGVRAHNVVGLIQRTGVREVHMRFEDEARTREVADLL